MRYYGRNQLSEINHEKGEHNVNPYPKGFWKLDIPEAVSGKWSITKFTVPDDISTGLMNLQYVRDGRPDRIVPPGNYTKLVREGCVIMSDTPAEAHEHYYAFTQAQGHVLLNGLGLGFFLTAILAKKEVTNVTVIEQSPDVIKLIGPVFKDKSRITIIEADAHKWTPPKGVRYGFVWHDIWDDICEDNREEMRKLRRKYSRRCDQQDCWSAKYL